MFVSSSELGEVAVITKMNRIIEHLINYTLRSSSTSLQSSTSLWPEIKPPFYCLDYDLLAVEFFQFI